MTVLGFDYGRRHIGVASGSTDTGLFEPLTTISVSAESDVAIASLIERQHPQRLIVGVSERTSAQEAAAFASSLRARFRLPVELVDETLSSQEARNKLFHVSPSKRRGRIHAAAAALILDQWLQSHTTKGPS